MSTGISLHIGLNAVDPQHYQGWSGVLAACELDANDMTMIAKKAGFQPTTLLTKKSFATGRDKCPYGCVARSKSG